MLPGEPALERSLACPVARAVWRLQADIHMPLSSRFRHDCRSPFFDPGHERGKTVIIGEFSSAIFLAVRASHFDYLRVLAGMSVLVRVWDLVP